MVGQVVGRLCAKFGVDPSSSFDVRAIFLCTSLYSVSGLPRCTRRVISRGVNELQVAIRYLKVLTG